MSSHLGLELADEDRLEREARCGREPRALVPAGRCVCEAHAVPAGCVSTVQGGACVSTECTLHTCRSLGTCDGRCLQLAC